MKRKIVCILMSLVLVMSMAVPTFAAKKTVVKKNNEPRYLAIGDSIGTGVKGMQMLDEEEYKSSATFGEDKSKNWNVHSVEHSYVNRVADAIGANKESWNGTFVSLRAKDYCYFLGLADDTNLDKIFSVPLKIDLNELGIHGIPDLAKADIGKMIESANLEEVQDNWDVISEDAYCWLMYSLFWKDYTEEINTTTLKKAVKKADVITIELGENEITATAVGDIMCRIVPSVIDVLVSVKNIKAITAYIDLLYDFNGFVQNPNIDKYTKNKKIINDLIRTNILTDSLKEVIGECKDLSDEIERSVNRANKEYRIYTERLVKYIREVNPNATVIVTTLPNPGKGFNIKNLVATLGIDNSYIPNIDLEPMMKPVIDSMNKYLHNLAKEYNLKIADISGVLINPDDPAYCFHPDANGHQQIADIIVATYNEAIAKEKKSNKQKGKK